MFRIPSFHAQYLCRSEPYILDSLLLNNFSGYKIFTFWTISARVIQSALIGEKISRSTIFGPVLFCLFQKRNKKFFFWFNNRKFSVQAKIVAKPSRFKYWCLDKYQKKKKSNLCGPERTTAQQMDSQLKSDNFWFLIFFWFAINFRSNFDLLQNPRCPLVPRWILFIKPKLIFQIQIQFSISNIFDSNLVRKKKKEKQNL